MSDKHEWRKQEKQFYLPKRKPEVVNIPEFKFISISGEGNPNSAFFQEHIRALYPLAYTIKMTLKKQTKKPKGYQDFTVYPLEGVWDIKVEARENFTGIINPDDLVYEIMLRQPDFVDDAIYAEMFDIVKKKKPNPLYDKIKFHKVTEGKCVQMLHVGKFADEPASFSEMEAFAKQKGLTRLSKIHREIYLSDLRKTAPEKLKTVLRFNVR
ncbi:MAG: GyrI-like domain-containing protein [Cellvibrionaceae bacterium]